MNLLTTLSRWDPGAIVVLWVSCRCLTIKLITSSSEFPIATKGQSEQDLSKPTSLHDTALFPAISLDTSDTYITKTYIYRTSNYIL